MTTVTVTTNDDDADIFLSTKERLLREEMLIVSSEETQGLNVLRTPFSRVYQQQKLIAERDYHIEQLHMHELESESLLLVDDTYDFNGDEDDDVYYSGGEDDDVGENDGDDDAVNVNDVDDGDGDDTAVGGEAQIVSLSVSEEPEEYDWEVELNILSKRVEGEVHDDSCKRKLLRYASKYTSHDAKSRCFLLDAFLSAVGHLCDLRVYYRKVYKQVRASLSSLQIKAAWKRITFPLKELSRVEMEKQVFAYIVSTVDHLHEMCHQDYAGDCVGAVFWPVDEAICTAVLAAMTPLRLRDDVAGEFCSLLEGARKILKRGAMYSCSFETDKLDMCEKATSIVFRDYLGKCLSRVEFQGQVPDNLRVCDMIRREADLVHSKNCRLFDGDSQDLGLSHSYQIALVKYHYRNITVFLNVTLQGYKNCVLQNLTVYQRFRSTMSEVQEVMSIMRDEHGRREALRIAGYHEFVIRNQLILVNPAGTIKIRIKKKVWMEKRSGFRPRECAFYFLPSGERVNLAAQNEYTGQYTVAMMPLNPLSRTDMDRFARKNNFLSFAQNFKEQQEAYLFFKTSELFKFFMDRGQVGCISAFNYNVSQKMSDFSREWPSDCYVSWPLSNYYGLRQESNLEAGLAYMGKAHSFTCAREAHHCPCTAHNRGPFYYKSGQLVAVN
jgi:hypothetical protein